MNASRDVVIRVYISRLNSPLPSVGMPNVPVRLTYGCSCGTLRTHKIARAFYRLKLKKAQDADGNLYAGAYIYIYIYPGIMFQLAYHPID